MPQYCTVADMDFVISSQKLAQLTDDDSPNNPTVDDNIVEAAIDCAEGIVENSLGRQYTVPFDTPLHSSIKYAILRLAKCELYLRRGKLPEDLQEQKDQTMEWLQNVLSGELIIPGLGGEEGEAAVDDAAQGVNPSVYSTDGQTFDINPF